MALFAKSLLLFLGMAAGVSATTCESCYDPHKDEEYFPNRRRRTVFENYSICECPKLMDDLVNMGCYVYHPANSDLLHAHPGFHSPTRFNYNWAHKHYRIYGKNENRPTDCHVGLPPGCNNFWSYLKNHHDVEAMCSKQLPGWWVGGKPALEPSCAAGHYINHGKSEHRTCSKNYTWAPHFATCQWRRVDGPIFGLYDDVMFCGGVEHFSRRRFPSRRRRKLTGWPKSCHPCEHGAGPL